MARPGDEPRDGDETARRSGTRRGLGDARSYTPRGRSLHQQPRSPSAEPFRPALRVVDGGGTGDRTVDRGEEGDGPTRPRRAPAKARPDGKAKGRTDSSASSKARRAPQPSGRAAPEARRRDERDVPGQRGRRPSTAGRRPPADPPVLGDPRRRLRLATVLAVAMFAVIGIRLVGVQVADASSYAQAGLRTRLATVALPARRGAILDRNRAVLAHSVEARYVYVDPTKVKDPVGAAAALTPLLGVANSDLLAKIQPHVRADGEQAEFEYLQRGVTPETGAKVAALKLPGIEVVRDERREVPGHDLAANLIGFTGADLNGLEGMEARYDDLLRGHPGQLVYERSGDGGGYGETEIPGGYRKQTPAKPGSSLRLTIDRDLQFFAQRTLFERMRADRADWAAAVVMDPHTGEVLAQASYPTYDAADPLSYSPLDREDRASGAVVDPGSVHKAIVLGAALQEGKINADTSLVIGPTITKGDQVFRDTHPNYKPRAMSLAGILAYSSNVGTIKIADRLGAQKLVEYQRLFGLGAATGEGIPGESSGLVQPPDRWSGSSYGSVPIGHGVAVTPLQMAAAYSVIANDGTWIQPHLIAGVVNPDGKEKALPGTPSRRVLSPENANVLRHKMEAVVAVEGATGTSAAIRGYRVAGKTGTGAQVVGGQYVAGEVASFVGMAPVDNPRYVVAVFAHTPGGEGGAVAAPAFRDLMSYALTRAKVTPNTSRPPSFVLYP